MGQTGVQARPIGRLGRLGELPGRAGLDVGVHRAHEDPEGFQGVADLRLGEGSKELPLGLRPKLPQVLFQFLIGPRGRDRPRVVPSHHVEQSVHEVAEVVAEVGLVALREVEGGEIRILTDDHLAAEIIAERIGAELLGEAQAVGGVAIALRSLRAVQRPPTVHEQLLRRDDIEGLEHAGPIHRMGRREDVLADHVHVGGPAALADHGGVVVRQRVEPDIRDEFAIERELDAPREPGLRTGDAEVVHRLLQELEHLLATMRRIDEVRIVLQVLDEPGLELRQLEVVVLLGGLGHFTIDRRPVALGVAVLVAQELLLAHGVPTGLGRLEDQALVEELLQEILHHRLVAGFGGPDVVVVRDVQQAEHLLENRGHLVDQRLGLDLALLGRLLDLLAVFIEAGQEVHVVAQHAVVTRQDVREDLFVGMAEVRGAIRIIDGGGDVERTRHC